MNDLPIQGPLSQMPLNQSTPVASASDELRDTSSDVQSSSINDYKPPVETNSAEQSQEPHSKSDHPLGDITENSQPTTSAPTSLSASTSAPLGTSNQSLEEQNIFHMLGVKDGSPEEREAFLDELQRVIWEDFIEDDVELLITEEELKGLDKIRDENYENEEERQEKIVVYLEKLIPDLEEIMLEKALELKEDLFKERISDMKAYYKDQEDAVQKISQAENLMQENKWYDAASLLNGIA